VRSPIGEIREGDIPGAIENPSSAGEQQSTPMQKINRTTPTRADLTSIDVEKEDLGKWEAKDNQFKRALEVLKTFGTTKPGQP
jgi:hypothetical protein